MRKLIKPTSLLLYLLTMMVFFSLGSWYAVATDAAKGQMLAGGAIVLFHGVVVAFFAFFAALFLVYNSPHKTVVIANQILAVVLVVLIVIFVLKRSTRERDKSNSVKIEINHSNQFGLIKNESTLLLPELQSG